MRLHEVRHRLLQCRIDRGPDLGQRPRLGPAVPEHPAREVRRADDGIGGLHVDGHRGKALALIGGQKARVLHGPEDAVLSSLGAFGVAKRIVATRGPGQAHESRGLSRRQVAGRLSKVELRGGLNAVGPIAK